jgi:hypothetical protein
MRKWMFAFLTVVLFLSFAVPVWADDGDGDVILFGESIVVGPGEVVDGDLAVVGGNLELRGGSRVRGDVVSLGGSAIVDGRIDGSLVVVGGTLDLQSQAVIEKDLFTFGGSVSRAEGATIRGERIEGFRWESPEWRGWRPLPSLPRIGEPWRWEGDIVSNLFSSFLRAVFNTVALMALGVVLMLLLPKQTAQVGQTASAAPLPSIGVGLLTSLVLLILVPLLVIICIGIPVAILLVLAAVAAGLFGWIAVGAVVGQRLLAALKVGKYQPLLEVIIGIPVISLLSAVPCLGWLLALIIAWVGLGAVVLTRFGTMAYAPVSKTPDLPPPPPEPDLPSAPEEETEE